MLLFAALHINCSTLTGEFPYAKCFVCGEMGHLSRSCPDNPKGLYAEGENSCLKNHIFFTGVVN